MITCPYMVILGFIDPSQALKPKENNAFTPQKANPVNMQNSPQNTTKEKVNKRPGLSLENYLKSKYIGRPIYYFDQAINTFVKAQVLQVRKLQDQIQFMVYNNRGGKVNVSLKFKKNYWRHISKQGSKEKKRSKLQSKLKILRFNKRLSLWE